ncbi:MAG: 50S ribosomal protein L24 [Phycisphaeraceae bacterium]|nr:50S ribosomal protein L24 [Phycisphaeraceae bacterium]
MARHIKKGDTVLVIAGSEKGQQGTVLKVDPANGKVIVKDINVKQKTVRPSRQQPKGGLVRREMPIDISNVAPMVNGRATRVRFETRPDGSKVRIAARSGAELGVVRQNRSSN